jgi:hypothetical protein
MSPIRAPAVAATDHVRRAPERTAGIARREAPAMRRGLHQRSVGAKVRSTKPSSRSRFLEDAAPGIDILAG